MRRGGRAERGWFRCGRPKGLWLPHGSSWSALYGASAEGGLRRWGTRTNWPSGLRNDIDLRKMATEEKPRSANCRHVPEASELNRENGRCLEVLKQTVLLGRTKVQLDRELLAALLPEAQLSPCASGPVLCGSRITEHKQRPRCSVDGSWPRRLVTPQSDVRHSRQWRAGEGGGGGGGPTQ